MKIRITNRLAGLFSHYLSSKIVLAMDLLLSVSASFLVMVIGGLFHREEVFNPLFLSRYLPVSLLWSIAIFLALRTHKKVIRHTSANDVTYFALASLLKGEFAAGTLALLALLSPLPGLSPNFWLLGILDAVMTLVLLVATRVFMIVGYQALLENQNDKRGRQNVLVYGISEISVAHVKRLRNSRHYKVVGFISTSVSGAGLTLEGIPAFFVDSSESLMRAQEQSGASIILFPERSLVNMEQNRIVRVAFDLGLKIMVVPDSEQVREGDRTDEPQIREIKISDVLGRKEIRISMEKIRTFLEGKTVLVTGAAGSIGSELCRQLAKFKVGKLIFFDNAETPMHNLKLEFSDEHPEVKCVSVIGDVRSPGRLDYVFRKWQPEIVFHAAAYKHVPLMEENPCESVVVNLGGTRNVADKCLEYGVDKMVMISTDKAVNPSNVMGASKRLAEMYVQALGPAVESGARQGRTRFVTTRFGNVLGSNGSVIPRFAAQINKGGPVTVTHRDVNRYFMTIPEACRLVLEAVTMSEGNNIYAFDMGDPVKIDDLARHMIRLAGLKPDVDIKIVYTGLRPGEKLYEEVLSGEENTAPSSHKRIRVANVRKLEYDGTVRGLEEIMGMAQNSDMENMVRSMKKMIPEFLSCNSKFSAYDEK
ncbi:MAG: polysaccharide biosynthesis protein [Bacteroidales bacterium]|nr:polysaccharide biosynthesis protein [Bacteroidales bacterium]